MVSTASVVFDPCVEQSLAFDPCTGECGNPISPSFRLCDGCDPAVPGKVFGMSLDPYLRLFHADM